MLKVSIVGGFTLDTNVYKGKVKESVGGPPHYILDVLSSYDVELILVSAVGSDFPKNYLDSLSSSVECYVEVVNKPNIRFRNEYLEGGERVQYVSGGNYLINLDEYLIERLIGSDFIIVSSVLNELSVDSLGLFRGLNKVAVDPQGFLRFVGDDDRVYLKAFSLNALAGWDVVKMSFEEYLAIDDKVDFRGFCKSLSCGIVAVTCGDKGSVVCIDGDVYFVPAYDLDDADPTGAGDVYLANLVYGLLRGWSYYDILAFCSIATSLYLMRKSFDVSIVLDLVSKFSDFVEYIDWEDVERVFDGWFRC